ncbi:MAG TPA: DUF2231 domain-containing protein [Candidatus Polarisedimenticolaceae bacterium]|nr:DUF2231 domain-containing protein [Candidatus Polarisedimenticolaceae bacterium]
MLHLVHPALIHFAIAFLVSGAVCEAYGLLRGHAALERFGGVLFVAGALALVPAIVSGYVAANSLDVPPSARELLELHERNGLVLFGLCSLTLLWKGWSGGRVAHAHRVAYAGLLAGAVVLTLTSAWLGGRMVYFAGVGTLGR